MDKKQKTTATFDLVANGYNNPSTRFFNLCADRLVRLLELKPGEQLLDAATGTGMVALAAAIMIAPGGRVQAIDLSGNMLKVAKINLEKSGLDNVDFHCMDAESPEFKNSSFDVLSCSFGLFFFDDMLMALKNWFQLLKPGGRLMYTSFASSAFQPLTDQFFSDIQDFGVEPPPADWRKLETEQECCELLEQSGYASIRTREEQLGYHLASPEDWWEIVMNAGYRGMVEQVPADQFESFRKQHLASIQTYMTDRGLWLDVMTRFSSANRPG